MTDVPLPADAQERLSEMARHLDVSTSWLAQRLLAAALQALADQEALAFRAHGVIDQDGHVLLKAFRLRSGQPKADQEATLDWLRHVFEFISQAVSPAAVEAMPLPADHMLDELARRYGVSRERLVVDLLDAVLWATITVRVGDKVWRRPPPDGVIRCDVERCTVLAAGGAMWHDTSATKP